MKVTQLHVDRASYYLPVNHDSRALQQQMVTAASGAPAFVTFRPADETEVTVLVTAHTSVRFEVVDRSEPSVEDDDAITSVDQYGFLDAG